MMRRTLVFGLTALLLGPVAASARQDVPRRQVPDPDRPLIAPPSATPQPEDDPKAFARRMIGTYTIDRGQRGEERLSGEALEGSIEVTEDRIALLRADGSEQYAARYTVDNIADRTARITLETVKVKQPEELQTESRDDVGTTGKALATLDGGTLTIIYDAEGEEYPDDFTPDDEEQHLFVLKEKGDSR